jgi:hypothetical protein
MEQYLKDFHHYNKVFQEVQIFTKVQEDADTNNEQLCSELERELKNASQVPIVKQCQLMDITHLS